MPTPDDIDPVQDRKHARESGAAQVIDGRPISGPAFPSHAKVVELDDTPGCRVPSEWLDQSPSGAAVLRRQRRLRMAFDLFRSLVAGCWREAVGPGNSTGKIRQWCWEQADAFLGEGDQPTPAVTAMATLNLSEQHEAA